MTRSRHGRFDKIDRFRVRHGRFFSPTEGAGSPRGLTWDHGNVAGVPVLPAEDLVEEHGKGKCRQKFAEVCKDAGEHGDGLGNPS